MAIKIHQQRFKDPNVVHMSEAPAFSLLRFCEHGIFHYAISSQISEGELTVVSLTDGQAWDLRVGEHNGPFVTVMLKGERIDLEVV